MALHPRLKCFLFLAAILLAIMGLPASAHSASVADTSWRDTDMFGTKMDFYFGADGMLIARDPQGIVTGTASWKQTDDLVEIEFNNGFVLLKGALAGDQLGGVGISRMGRSGPWSIKREAQNFESLVQLHASRMAPLPVGMPNAAALKGRYVGLLNDGKQTYKVTLDCSSDTSCSLVPPQPASAPARTLAPVSPRLVPPQRMAAYQNALNFVRNNRFEPGNLHDPIYQTLRPLVEGDTTLERCHELWQPGPPPELICAPRTTADRPVWVYFAPLMTCGPNFCAALPIALYPARD